MCIMHQRSSPALPSLPFPGDGTIPTDYASTDTTVASGLCAALPPDSKARLPPGQS